MAFPLLLLGRLLPTLVVVLLVSCVSARKNITFNDSNARFRYSPPLIQAESACRRHPENTDCEGRWWTEVDNAQGTLHNDAHITFGPDTAVEFDFQGIFLYYYAITLDFGPSATVSIDGQNKTTVSLRKGTSPMGSQLIWVSPELDPIITHTFRLEFDNTFAGDEYTRKWLSLDYVTVTVEDSTLEVGEVGEAAGSYPSAPGPKLPGTHIDATPPVSSVAGSGTTAAPTASSDAGGDAGGGGLSQSTITGLAVGVTVGVLALAMVPLLCCIYRRRRRAVLVRSWNNSFPARTANSGPSLTVDTYVYARRPLMVAVPRTADRFDAIDARRYSAMYMSAPSSVGLPVDERPAAAPSTLSGTTAPSLPCVPAAAQPPAPRITRFSAPRSSRAFAAQHMQRFRLHNPDASSRGTSSHIASQLSR